LCFLDTFWTMKCISAGGTFSEVISFSSLLFSRYYYCYCYSYSPKLCLSVSLSVCCARKAKFIREPTYSRDIVTFSLLCCVFCFCSFGGKNVNYSSKNLSQRMSFAKKRSSSSFSRKAETTKEMTTTTNNNTNDENSNNTNTNNSSSSKKSSSFTLPPSPNRETMFSFHCSATCSHGMLR